MTNQGANKLELGIIPDASEVFGRRAATFAKLVAELRSISEAERQLKDEKADLNKRLIAMFADSPAKTVLEDGAKVTLVSSSSSHIDKQALIEAGVAATVIVACTKVSNYEYIKVTAEKE